MSLNFDTKLMKVADEFADFDLLKPKERPGPHFQTQETDSVFILSVQLKGYRRSDIKVCRNKDGSRIAIYGEKPFQDMLMVGGKVIKKDTEMQRFQISFKVPHGVVFDKVKSMINEDDSELIIRMPKATKGYTGIMIEELKTKEFPPESSELLPLYANGELSETENEDKNFTSYVNDAGLQENKNGSGEEKQKTKEQVGTNHANSKDDDSQEPNVPKRSINTCTSVLFGSAFFVSLIALLFHLVQSKKPEKEQKKAKQD